MYHLSGVTKRYLRDEGAVDALVGVDLVIGDGERILVRGPAGGGKSTLLRLLGGLDRPTRGSVLLDGTDLAALPEARLANVRAESIGFVCRSSGLVPALSARQNVETALVPLGLGPDARGERAAAALDSVGLRARGGRLPAELDGGEIRRVALARALVKRPKVLLADDPAGGLAGPGRAAVMELLDGLREDHGLTLVLATRDGCPGRRAARVITLQSGRVTRHGGRAARPTGRAAPSADRAASSADGAAPPSNAVAE
ncbi:ATP-binding cassette domain-containing protein [Streptomyces sp. NPDC052114]|uniref:ABC transporter ATP-binding protein n=1 Tax=unclassified Streptomyces TaxID=2593676 RepID=UPI003424D156